MPSKFDFPSHECKPPPKKRLSRNSIASSSNVNINVTKVHKHDDSHDKIVEVYLSKKVPENENSDEKLKLEEEEAKG